MKIKSNPNNVAKAPSMKPKANLSVLFVGLVIMSILAVITFFALRNIMQTETYYIVGTNIPAKTQVHPDMMKPVTVSLGGAPKRAIKLSQVATGTVFTKYPVIAGDILTESNTGVSLDTTTGIPDSWVITSFDISSSQAVGGNINRGDYFDIIGIANDKGAKYIATNVLALEASNSIKEQQSKDGSNTIMNESIQYIVGMPPDAAAKFHHAMKNFEEIRIVKSPNVISYESRTGYDLNKVYKFDPRDSVMDLLKGTDKNFTPIIRDSKGRPVTKESCDKGIIVPAEMCQTAQQNVQVTDNAQTTETSTNNITQPNKNEQKNTTVETQKESTNETKAETKQDTTKKN